MKNNVLIFPKGFFWGAATASHQVEGNNLNDWSKWEKENAERLAKEAKKSSPKWQQDKFPEMLEPSNYISGIACNHYNFFRDDFKMAKELGHNATRFSLEWSRIEPKEGCFEQKELKHYQEVVRTLRKLGIEPFVTLWHWPLPLWLQEKGGWQSKKISDYFSRYVQKVVSVLKNDVKYWITLNEPEIYTSLSFLYGIWPPQEKSLVSYLRVLHNLIKAHRQAYKTIKSLQPTAQIGIAKNNVYFEAYKNKPINVLLKKGGDWWWNFYFLDRINEYQDFIGLNHYFYNKIDYGFNKNDNKIVSDAGLELYPEAIYRVLMDLKKYQKPIYITESGLADAKDEKRAWFLAETLKNVHKAISEGIDVRGYLHWTLMDNFEWDKGFWPRFGLLAVDRKTLVRKPRPSAYFYKDICLANGINNDLVKKHQNL